jgi:hypothetical protein
VGPHEFPTPNMHMLGHDLTPRFWPNRPTGVT